MNAALDLSAFPTVLAETIAWCSQRRVSSRPADALWSAELRPAVGRLSDLNEGLIHYVIEKRRRLLHTNGQLTASSLASGRLLAYEPGQNLCDGAAPLASDDFFDVDNVPSWDTWLGFIYGKGIWQRPGTGPQLYLLSWVPPAFLTLADAGIEANPEQCIRWAVDDEHEFFRQLDLAGLLA